MVHAPHKKVQNMIDLEIIQGLRKRTPQLNFTCPVLMIAKSTQLIHQPIVSINFFPVIKHIQPNFILFNIAYIRGFKSEFNVIDATLIYQFGFPDISKFPPVSLIK